MSEWTIERKDERLGCMEVGPSHLVELRVVLAREPQLYQVQVLPMDLRKDVSLVALITFLRPHLSVMTIVVTTMTHACWIKW